MPPPNQEFSDIRYMPGNAVTCRVHTGPGENARADAPRPAPGAQAPGTGCEGGGGASPNRQGLPFLKPSYGFITAIDTGDRGDRFKRRER